MGSGFVRSRVAWTVVAVLVAMLAVPFPVRASEAPGVLVLGRVSDDPKSQYEAMKALLDYVVPKMADVGIREGRVLMANDALQMASYLRRGRVDWVSETAGGAMLLQRRAGAEPFVLSERNGTRRYHTIYFARKDGDVRSIDDLRGRRIAFQNRTSTSAYFVPAMELLGRGMALDILTSPTDAPAPGAVGFVFARTERNVATWVHKHLVDVGTVSDLDWNDPRKVPDFFRNDFIILRETPDMPRGVEMVRGDLDAKVRERLRAILIAAADDPQARVALGRFHRSLRFFPIEDGDRADLARLRKGVDRVSRDIE